MKQGSKVPVMTGGYSHESAPGTEYQFTYIDVGLNCTATLTERADGLEAAIKLERSSVAETPSTLGGVQEPVIRQAVLENTSILKPGTPVMIGSLDVPGSTRHLDIEVAVERVM
jgi:type II secretory pathway component GspD/PulD (secretin)